MNRRHLLGAGVGALLMNATLSRKARAHDGHDHHGAASTKVLRTTPSYAVPDVMLIDAQSRPVRLRALLASREPVMMNFIFTTCGATCPAMSQVFSEVPARLGPEAARLRMVSISIDPENDTPAELQGYARKFHAGAQWTFLTGKSEDVISVQRAFDNYRGDKMNHEALTLMHVAPGDAWVRLEGFANSAMLAQELRKALVR